MAQPGEEIGAMPDRGLEIQRPEVAIDLFHRGAQANYDCPLRRGSTVHLPAQGRLLVTGDLHDHTQNFRRILLQAGLHHDPDQHLILQEMIHGQSRFNGRDMSIRLLVRAAAVKVAFPNQVHFLQSNHELAQLNGDGILKDGASLIEQFEEGVQYIYGNDADNVTAAMNDFIMSFPVAVRAPDGLFIAHSLPSPRQVDSFDPAVLDRLPVPDDLTSAGSVHHLVWGRNHTPPALDRFAAMVDARLFIVGHQPVEMGYDIIGDRLIILACDHVHGMMLPIDLSERYTLSDLVERLIPLASIPMD